MIPGSERSASVIESVKRVLREHNQSVNPILWSKLDQPESAARALNIIAYDGIRTVIGGLLAEVSFSWLRLEILAVRSDMRRQGIGTRLVRRAESEARLYGCKYAFVDTMDYQAPGFFHHLGYSMAGTISDWDSHGHTKYFLTKGLPSAE